MTLDALEIAITMFGLRLFPSRDWNPVLTQYGEYFLRLSGTETSPVRVYVRTSCQGLRGYRPGCLHVQVISLSCLEDGALIDFILQFLSFIIKRLHEKRSIFSLKGSRAWDLDKSVGRAAGARRGNHAAIRSGRALWSRARLCNPDSSVQ